MKRAKFEMETHVLETDPVLKITTSEDPVLKLICRARKTFVLIKKNV
jgi:hypothetical protein